ncbi:MAG: ATP-binding cassette domain-containing protein [Pseudomonadota bacterium]
MAREIILSIKNLVNRFGAQVVHDNLCLDVYRGEILGVVGGSGTGKSVLLNTILGLHQPNQGSITIFDVECSGLYRPQRIESRWGVLFQSGALFSSMTVGENIAVPMREIAHMSEDLIEEMIPVKLTMVGLDPETAFKLPEELSGGMVKRAALARALAIDAELLFLDEPTSGLDPIGATAFDKLIKALQQTLNLTVVMITHDLDSLHAICDRIAILVDKKIIVDSTAKIQTNPHPWIQEYFMGERGQIVFGR